MGLPTDEAGQPITVHKLDTQGRFVIAYTGRVSAWLPTGLRIEAIWTRPTLSLGYTTFETGDLFIEWYYTDRWYSIIEIRAQGGALKGWYCNIAAPATIIGDLVAYRDLLLDLWVAPDGQTLTLDEDEFADDTTLDAPTRAQARVALAALQSLGAERASPFDALPAVSERSPGA